MHQWVIFRLQFFAEQLILCISKMEEMEMTQEARDATEAEAALSAVMTTWTSDEVDAWPASIERDHEDASILRFVLLKIDPHTGFKSIVEIIELERAWIRRQIGKTDRSKRPLAFGCCSF